MLSFLINADDPEQDGLLDSFFSSGKAISQELVRNDKVLAFQIVPVVPSAGGTQLWSPDHLSTDTYLVAVGNEDEPPTGGTWPLTLGANTASAIPYDVTAAALETALMAASFGTLTVLLLQAGVYQVTWTANGAVAQMTSGANTLSPDAGVTVSVVSAGSASTQAVQVVTLRQSVVAAAAPATQLPAADIVAAVERAGSGTVNKIYSLTMTPGTYGGTFSLTVTAATGAAQGLGVVDANISADDFAALLATQTVIASVDNVSVQRVGNVLNVEFVGTQGLSNVPVIAVTNVNLLAPEGVSGTINFNTIPLNRAFWNTTETELTYRLAVRRTRATGEEREFYNASVTLKRNLIDTATMVAVFTGGITIGATGVIGGTSGRVLYDNAGVVGEYPISGTGSVAMTTSPSFTAPTLGAATATSINGNTISAGTGTLNLGSATILMDDGGDISTRNGGGKIETYGDGTPGSGGRIDTHGSAAAQGGIIDTSQGGGSINTSQGGGSINTTAGGSITTGTGSLTGPAASGTIALTSDITGGTLAGSFTTVNGKTIQTGAGKVLDSTAQTLTSGEQLQVRTNIGAVGGAAKRLASSVTIASDAFVTVLELSGLTANGVYWVEFSASVADALADNGKIKCAQAIAAGEATIIDYTLSTPSTVVNTDPYNLAAFAAAGMTLDGAWFAGVVTILGSYQLTWRGWCVATAGGLITVQAAQKVTDAGNPLTFAGTSGTFTSAASAGNTYITAQRLNFQ